VALLLRPEDFERLAVRAAYPEIEIVPDRFGVVPPGEAIILKLPSADVSLSSVPFLRERVELADDRIMAMRYCYETCLRQPPVFFGCVFTGQERWRLKWRVSMKRRERIKRRLDRRSNVRRRKRHAELRRRGAAR